MSFVPTQKILQIIRVAVLRDHKRGSNRGVPIVLHEFADKLRTDGISIEELSDALRFLLLHIASAFLQATEHIVEPSHHFLPFLRVEVDPDAVLACQEVRRPVYLGGGCRQMMTLQQGFHLCFGCRRRLRLIKLLHRLSHRLAIRVGDQVSPEIVDKLLIMLPEKFAGFRSEGIAITIDDLGSLQGKVPFDLLDRLVCDLCILLLDTRPIPDTVPRDETPEHHVVHPKGVANRAHVDRIRLLVQQVDDVHEGLAKRHHPEVRHVAFIPTPQVVSLAVRDG